MNLKSLVEGLLSELNKVSESNAVVGAPRDLGKATMVPLSRISVGFGAATGQAGGKSDREDRKGGGNAEGGGVGGAIVVEPRAFVVVAEDGRPYMMALKKGKAAVVRRGVTIDPRLEMREPVAELTSHQAASLPARQSIDDDSSAALPKPESTGQGSSLPR